MDTVQVGAEVSSNGVENYMSSKEERKELISEPLPVSLSDLAGIIPVDYTLVSSDRVLTSIVQIDEQIQQIQAILSPFLTNLGKQRELLMTRAHSEGIKEDMGAVLVEVPGRKFRNEIEDLEALELQFPGKLDKIRTEQFRLAAANYEKTMEAIPESKIPLTLADEIIGKDEVTEFVGYKPQKITFEVRRK